jgi:glyoxylase-like metal-dependent hydrolase (beta-lactamase superfamily II)
MGLEVHEIADGVAMVEGFSHILAFDTGDGLVCFDTSLAVLAPQALSNLRSWSNEAVDTIVYTHGHVDHVGGAGAFLHDAHERGEARPRVIGHENVPARFARYDLTEGYVHTINARQFGGTGIAMQSGVQRDATAPSWVHPSVVYEDRLDWRVGDTLFELRHGKGETDDHTWAFVPSHRAAVVGDFLIWMFPNAGNPQKVQRYPREWALALRQMAAAEPELLLPAHGLPVAGRERIARMLDDTASALEHLVGEVLAMMNGGHRLDDILHTVRIPDDLASRPFLQPLYDEPEFVIHNIWRLYGGWYDGNPARLKPPSDQAVARETAALAGGADVLVARALELAGVGGEGASKGQAGEGQVAEGKVAGGRSVAGPQPPEDHALRLACHLVELAVQAAPDDPEAHDARAEVYRLRRKTELSLMAKGIFGDAERTSRDRAGELRA